MVFHNIHYKNNYQAYHKLIFIFFRFSIHPILHTPYLTMLDYLDGVKRRIVDSDGCEGLLSLCVQDCLADHGPEPLSDGVAGHPRRVDLLDAVQGAGGVFRWLFQLLLRQLEQLDCSCRGTVRPVIRVREEQEGTVQNFHSNISQGGETTVLL